MSAPGNHCKSPETEAPNFHHKATLSQPLNCQLKPPYIITSRLVHSHLSLQIVSQGREKRCHQTDFDLDTAD